MSKPILCLDFDGVVHSYVSGWKGPRTIPDDPVDGALEFMATAMLEGWDVCIYSSRSHYWFGRMAMSNWLQRHAGNMWDTMGVSLCDVRFVKHKPPALVTIDDRAITFTGEWPDVKALRKFKPWNKK